MFLGLLFVFFQAEDGIRDLVRSRGLGDVYKRQEYQGANRNRLIEIPARTEIADGTAIQAAAHWLQPVSYTHLRAHETVLDLVCRLLLEKKKNKNKTTE